MEARGTANPRDVFGSLPLILYNRSRINLSEKTVWLAACLYEQMQLHEWIRPDRASLPAQAEWIQDEGNGPMC